jgi:hypothetical protein
MEETAQVKAAIPRELKRRAFAALALREVTFKRWVQRELEAFVQEIDKRERESSEERQVLLEAPANECPLLQTASRQK